MRKIGLQLCYAVAIAALTLTGCSKKELQNDAGELGYASRPGNSNTTYWGPVIQMGSGHIRSFGVLDKSDRPVQVGFELTAGALQQLPPQHSAPDHNGPHYMLHLHPKVQAATVFDHLVVDWNASGHGPDPYLAPHFDFHMYMIPNNVRLKITANDPKSVASLPNGYLPADYIGPIGPEPQMGGHCVDITSPELLPPTDPNSRPFTQTFIYGAYDGKIAFYEPMITLDYLANVSTEVFSIKQPANFSKPGYYPTSYTVYKDAASDKRYVVLTDFVLRN